MQSRIQTLRHHIAAIQEAAPTMENQAQKRCWEIALSEELKAEENFWKLKARKDWLTTHDLNTKHFHLSTVIRRRRNAIEFIKDGDGTWMSSRHAIGSHIFQHFQTLFTSSDPAPPDDLDHLIDPIITTEENDMLCAIPTDLEIFKGIRDIGPHKSLGPNGMTGLFFEHYWPIVGPEVTAMIKSFFLRGFISFEINHSHIILIPKIDSPYIISHFRRISLCNVTYKLIAKILLSACLCAREINSR